MSEERAGYAEASHGVNRYVAQGFSQKDAQRILNVEAIRDHAGAVLVSYPVTKANDSIRAKCRSVQRIGSEIEEEIKRLHRKAEAKKEKT